MKIPGYVPDKQRIILELFRHTDMKPIFESLHAKTGMSNSVDIVKLALRKLDASLPPLPAPTAPTAK